MTANFKMLTSRQVVTWVNSLIDIRIDVRSVECLILAWKMRHTAAIRV